MRFRALRGAAIVTAALAIASCGGGGDGSPTLSEGDLNQIRSDPRVVRLEGILERSDALLVPTVHYHYALKAEGEAVSDRAAVEMSCARVRCVGDDGTVITVHDLVDPFAEIDLTEASIGSRSGFDTLTLRGGFDASHSISGVSVTSAPAAESYGIWGEHGYAAVTIVAGPWSGQVEGTPFRGDFDYAGAFAVGDVAGTNPVGMGSATWTGIAVAASTHTFKRRQGTATVTMADLSPSRSRSSLRVGVEIDVSGYAIGTPEWADMRLRNGSFTTGRAGRDYVEGNFHGPDHSETYGVFDTGAYIGAFGAKRDQ